jgi:tRNA(adenine34) deaminase
VIAPRIISVTNTFMPKPLTESERDVLDYLIEYLRENTYPPSVREIGGRLGIRSTRKVAEILDVLAVKGWIERTPARSRAMRVLVMDPPEGPVAADACTRFDEAQPDDAVWMQRALEQARAAQTVDEVPVGAVLVRAADVLAESYNLTRTLADPTAHAEMIVIRHASARANGARLTGATLYVTLEPCAMCAGAIVLAKIERLVYGAADPKTGMCGSLGCIVQDRRLNHRVRVTRGVLEQPAGELLRTFFQARR